MLAENCLFKHGQLWEVRCRGCGAAIRKMVPSDEHQETQKLNGKTVVFQRLVFASVGNYREVLLDCGGGPGDDFIGAKHVACMCAGCANTASVEQFQEHYDLDMADFQRQGIPVTRRAVNRAVRVAPQITE